jgi:hypothetical protein
MATSGNKNHVFMATPFPARTAVKGSEPPAASSLLLLTWKAK